MDSIFGKKSAADKNKPTKYLFAIDDVKKGAHQLPANRADYSRNDEEECSLPLLIATFVGAMLLIYYVVFNKSSCELHSNGQVELHSVSWNNLLFLQYKTKHGWSIDNIWPVENKDSGSSWRYCKVPAKQQRYLAFRYSNDASARKRLKGPHLWSSDYDEYTKYTSACVSHIEKLNTELKFLIQGMEWYDRYNVGETLLKCGIDTEASKSYKLSLVRQCFMDNFNVEPKFGCAFDKILGEEILHQVGFCFDQDLKLKNCTYVGAPSEQFQSCY